MNSKTKQIIRKIIYAILFIAMIASFIYLSEKYADNSKVKVMTINDYYENISSDKFNILRGSEFVSTLKREKGIVFIGSNTSEYSKKYIEILESVIDEIDDLNSIYYYNINSDKNQKNATFYEIRDLLSDSLITTDNSKNNLLAPSLYIINKGEVLYYNIETVAMKNTDTAKNYWTEEKETQFKDELKEAINKYYLN
ncbi:MAG TPA: hypothetical protein DCE23_08560 [Firmicutes bacterium]|nr:hypothetical protein [Bacillota bacterium]